jgi:hypothetical protein
VGLCEDRGDPRHLKSCLPYPGVGGVPRGLHSARLLILLFAQIEAIRFVGISHLFLVPQIRTSFYLTLLAEAFPSLRRFSPGHIEEDALPDLRHIVVIDNTHQPKKFHEMLGDIHCAVDFREVLLWQDGDTKEARLIEEIRKTLDKDDAINLQFTRSFSRFIEVSDPRILSPT